MTSDLPKLAVLGLGHHGQGDGRECPPGPAYRPSCGIVTPAAADGDCPKRAAEVARPSVGRRGWREVDVAITMVTNSDAVMSIANRAKRCW